MKENSSIPPSSERAQVIWLQDRIFMEVLLKQKHQLSPSELNAVEQEIAGLLTQLRILTARKRKAQKVA